MAKLVELKTKSGGSVLMQISQSDASVGPVSSLDDAYEDAVATLDEGLAQLEAIGEAFMETLGRLAAALESAELELGFQATAKGKLFVVEAEGQASIKAKLVFKPLAANRPGAENG
jgi:hypothetical protein